MKIQGVALTQALCGQWIKKTVMETVHKEGSCEGSIELTADFYMDQHLFKNQCLKIINMKSELSWQECFQRTVVFM